MSEHTPVPWIFHRGGGNAYSSIRGSDSIHTNGRNRNAASVSSASYSDEVCLITADPDLPGPAANIRLIEAAHDVLEALEALGATPGGFCFCVENRDPKKPDHEHTGECRAARAAIAKATGEKSDSAVLPQLPVR